MREPVHVVYGGAHLFRADSAKKLGRLALASLDAHAPDAATFFGALGVVPDGADLDPAHELASLYAQVRGKLAREPVEDLRVDFEDGFGVRGDDEEDRAADAAVIAMVEGAGAGTLPPRIGVRIKSLGDETRARALRTLGRVLTPELAACGLPPGFVVTLPKVRAPDDLARLADALDVIEARVGVAPGTVQMEAMIETRELLFDASGAFALPRLPGAARGRLVAAHFGTYDYTASCDVVAREQRMDHPACALALGLMQVAFAGGPVRIADGATTLLPIGDRAAVHAAWRLHWANVRASLARGFYQSWDLHPAQLPVRFAATYAFFLEGAATAGERLVGFLDRAAQASRVGSVFDDAATGQGLVTFFLRALGCGALDEAEVLARTGLTGAELATRSFPTILARRAGRDSRVRARVRARGPRLDHDLDRRRLRRAALAALAVHVVLAGLVARARVLDTSRAEATQAAATEIDVAVESSPAAESAPPSPAPPSPAPIAADTGRSPESPRESASQVRPGDGAAAPTASRGAASGEGTSPVSASASSSGAGLASSGSSSAAPASSEGSGGLVGRHLSLGELGLAGPNRFVGTAAEAMREPTRAEQSERLERAIMAPILARDTALGLGPSGPVVTALESAAYVGASSKRGRARFQARTDVNGFVVEVVVMEVDGDRAAWEGVAREALGALRGRALRVPSRRKAMAMTIEVTSAWQMPTGRDPGVGVSVAGIPVKRGEGPTSTSVQVLGLPKVTAAQPTEDATSGVKLPDVRIELPVLRLEGDPADLGAKPRRVVHGKVLEEHLL